MEAYEYQTLYEFERTYWWYQHLHKVLLEMLLAHHANQNSRILDAGCGTGQNMDNLSEKISASVFGFDLSRHATPFWKKRNLERLCNASINQIPYVNDAFDYVVCVDVLESQEVMEDQAIAELVRITRPGGYICLVVPAYGWLMSPRHHQAVHAVRRYSRKTLLALFTHLPVQEKRTSNLFAPVFPLVAFYRLWLRLSSSTSSEPPRSELGKLPPWLNWILYTFVSFEQRILQKHDLPFGSSILTMVQKVK